METIPFERPPPVTYPSVTKLRYGPQYSCVNLANINDFAILKGHLEDYVEYLLENYEELLHKEGKKIQKFSIGKTYAILKKQNLSISSGSYSDKYTTQGIYWRFNNSYKKWGYDFLAAIVILTNENVPPAATQAFQNQHMLTLSLKSQLIQHFSYKKYDNRLANRNISPGNKIEPHEGFVLFLAVKTCFK